jgi:hypothetical protein
MFASRYLLRLLLLACLVVPRTAPAAEASTAEDPVAASIAENPAAERPIQVILTDGTILPARCVQPAPFNMVAVTAPGDSLPRYVSPVRIRAVLDAQGIDRTERVVESRRTLGVPFPRAVIEKPQRPPKVGPRAVTKRFLITETSCLARIDTRGVRSDDRGGEFAFDLGVMENIYDRTSVGYSAFVGVGANAHAGVRLRVRRWLNRTASVELAPGMVLLEHQTDSSERRLPALSLQASVSPSRYLTLTVEGFTEKQSRYGYRGFGIRDTGILAGLRLCGWPGAAVGALPVLAAFFVNSIQANPAPGIP